jgi:putative membrane protein
LNNYFVWIFIVLLPFGVIPEFSKIGDMFFDTYPMISKWFVWIAIPFIMIISWVFHTMQRIGTVGENPFEGSVNDVPISTIARGIEIDLREMLDEDQEKIPKSFPTLHHVQM